MLKDKKQQKLRHDLIHKYQMPYRGTIIAFSVFLFYGVTTWEALFATINICAYFWIVFDIFANLFWLKVPWHYVGKTDTVDTSFTKVVNWTLKALFFLISLVALLVI